jgi:hypothetical protein
MESPSAAYDQMTTGRIKDKLEVTSLGWYMEDSKEIFNTYI